MDEKGDVIGKNRTGKRKTEYENGRQGQKRHTAGIEKIEKGEETECESEGLVILH